MAIRKNIVIGDSLIFMQKSCAHGLNFEFSIIHRSFLHARWQGRHTVGQEYGCFGLPKPVPDSLWGLLDKYIQKIRSRCYSLQMMIHRCR